MSRWDAAVADQVPDELRDRLAIAVGMKTYQAYRELMDSDRWQRLANSGARVQRLLWASTSTKDPKAPDTLYVHALGAPFTINTMPEATLKAFFDHGACRRADAGRRRRQRGGSGRVRQAPASTSTRSPQSCSPTGPTASTTRGTT